MTGWVKGWKKEESAPTSGSLITKHSEQQTPVNLTDQEQADYTVMATMATTYLNEKDYQSALDMVNRLFKIYPIARDFPFYTTIRARSLFHLGRKEEAHEELRRGLFSKRLDINSFTKRIELWTDLGDLNGAEAEVTRIIQEADPITVHYMYRAQIRLMLGKFEEAEEDLYAAETLDDDPDRIGMAEKLRKGYAEKFPEYAKYLSGKGIDFAQKPSIQ